MHRAVKTYALTAVFSVGFKIQGHGPLPFFNEKALWASWNFLIVTFTVKDKNLPV
jgi:hypothetical protein